jgi:hypothetical protein
VNRNTGLTLLEVMISVLVLGLGLTAVAGLFPIAGAVQRATYDDMVSLQMGDTVEAMVRSRGFSIVDLVDPFNPLGLLTNKVAPVPAKVLDGKTATPTLVEWGLQDRCYPASMGGDPAYANRAYYWVPLVRRVNLTDWQVFIFVLKKEQGVDYGSHSGIGVANPNDPSTVPVVRSLVALTVLNGNQVTLVDLNDPLQVADPSAYFDVGDLVLDSDGVVHRVLDVSGPFLTLDGVVSPLVSEIWFAQRAANTSPTRRILPFAGGVVLK